MYTLIAALVALIVGGIVGYSIFRYVIKGKYNEMVEAANKEAEVVKEKKHHHQSASQLYAYTAYRSHQRPVVRYAGFRYAADTFFSGICPAQRRQAAG